MTIKKALLPLLLVFMGLLPAAAQRYKTAAGIRIGSEDFGFSVQQKILEKTTVEGMLMFSPDEVTATVLGERHFPMLGQRLNYYVGGGVHGGHLKDYGTIYGLDAIGGIEYKVNGLPILISGDIKPALHLRHEDWLGFGGGFSIRYVLIEEKPPTPGEIIRGIFKKKN